jgi:hypothetical protein
MHRVLSTIASFPLIVLAIAPGCDDESESCGECAPLGGTCADGIISYRYTWASACPPTWECEVATHGCALGCREEESREDSQPELVFMLCEEASVREVGFPCMHDVDCLTPIGATAASRLVSADGAAPSGSMETGQSLICGAEGRCERAGSSVFYSDVGSVCSAQSSGLLPGPVVAVSTACESGGCLMLEGGATQGSCTAGCVESDDCLAGYGCADVLDNRYFTWGLLREGIPPRISACVPSP